MLKQSLHIYIRRILTLRLLHIMHGEEGFLVPANDPYMAAFRIKQLHEDKDLNMKMGNACRITACKRHDRETIVKGLMDIYKKVIELDTKYKEEEI